MATLRSLIDEFGVSGCVREDRGNGCAGPMWIDEDVLGEFAETEMVGIAFAKDKGAAMVAYQAVLPKETPFYASAWIDGGNGYEFRLLF